MNSRRIRLVHRVPGGTEEIVVVHEGTGRTSFEDSSGRCEVDAVFRPDRRVSLIFDDGRQICGRVLGGAGDARVGTSARVVAVPIADPRQRPLDAHPESSHGSGEEIVALMPGRVVEVLVAEGQVVAAGAILLILEAMKMQNEIRASVAGRVSRLDVLAGQAVEQGTRMVSLEPPSDLDPNS